MKKLSDVRAPVTLMGSRPGTTSDIIHPGELAAIASKLRVRSRQNARSSLWTKVSGQTITSLAVLVRQRPQQDASDDAEDGGIGAGAERKQQERRDPCRRDDGSGGVQRAGS